jgi:hypothetical protein
LQQALRSELSIFKFFYFILLSIYALTQCLQITRARRRCFKNEAGYIVTVDESVVAELAEGLAGLLIGDKSYIRRRIETVIGQLIK